MKDEHFIPEYENLTQEQMKEHLAKKLVKKSSETVERQEDLVKRTQRQGPLGA